MRIAGIVALGAVLWGSSASADQLQADLGLTVIALGYEQPISEHVAVQLEGGACGTYFLPWFDAGDKVTGVLGGVRATWFAHPDGHGLYITPYLRAGYGAGKHEGGNGVSGDAALVTSGAFVGWALQATPKLDVRIGAGAQYIYLSGTHGLEASTPFVALDLTVGYRL
jgi:hypothetical protein